MVRAVLRGMFLAVNCTCGWWLPPLTAQDGSREASLVAAWPLQSDSGGWQAPAAINHQVVFEAGGPAGAADGCARFDGTKSYLEIPSAALAELDPQSFSIAVWIKLDDARDNPGEVLSRYDPAARRGFRLAVDSRAGVTSSQANWRNLHWGVDAGSELSPWTDHGQLGEAVLVYCMAVHAGQLFAGTCVPGMEASGRVYRFDGNSWTDCGSPDRANSVTSLAVYQGELYAASGKYRLRGSALDESENPHLGGGVFRYASDGQWVPCGRLPEVEAINGLVVFDDHLYASSMYAPAGLFRYDGGQQWTNCGAPEGGKRVESLAVFDGEMYATGYDEGAVYRYDGARWEHLGRLPEATQTYGFATYQGQLYVSEWPNAKVFRFTGQSGGWELAGRLGEELETMPLVVYNGKLYGGTLPTAEVYRWDPGIPSLDNQWTKVGRLDLTPDVRYRRVWSMAVFQGRLFAGTLPAGRVFSAQAGWNLTRDTPLDDGWHHVVAVVDRGELKMYVNGQAQASSAAARQAPQVDLFAGELPLTVGFGSSDYFSGWMSGLQLYSGAVTAEQADQLYRAGQSK